MRRLLLAALAAALALGAQPRASMDRDDPLEWEGSGRSFRPLTRFMVPDRNSAEIVSTTPDGRTLVYTDAEAVTLQENNGFAVIDLTNPAVPVRANANAGGVDNRRADLLDDDTIAFAQTYPADALAAEPNAGARIPDAIAWDAVGARVFLANEGEFAYTGGRGWSAFSWSGTLLWDDEGQSEQEAVARGYYPDGPRADGDLEERRAGTL